MHKIFARVIKGNQGNLLFISFERLDSPQCISETFFSYIINAMRIFKRQIEFIIIFQHLKAFLFILLGTTEIPASAVEVNQYVFGKFVCIHPTIAVRIAVRDRPRYLLSLAKSVICFVVKAKPNYFPRSKNKDTEYHCPSGS